MKPPYLTKIRTKRKRSKITQAEMAERLGIKMLSYKRLELGLTRLTVDRLIKIAEVLNIEVKDLL